MTKVVCTALSAEQGPHTDILRSAGFELVYPLQGINTYDPTSLLPVVRDCVAVVAGSEPWTADLIEACPKLRVLARCGVGFDEIGRASCRERVCVPV